MTTVVSSSSRRLKTTGATPPPRPPPPRRASSERRSKPLKESPVAKKAGCSEPASPSEPPPKPPRTYSSSLRQKSATLPSSLRGAGTVDMTEVLQRYVSTSTSDEEQDSLPSAGGARPMDGKRCTPACTVHRHLWLRCNGATCSYVRILCLVQHARSHVRTHVRTHPCQCVLNSRRTIFWSMRQFLSFLPLVTMHLPLCTMSHTHMQLYPTEQQRMTRVILPTSPPQAKKIPKL